ncbi:protein kinase, putative [Trypanosoma brucei gambiense DAL972]|uniref:Protein kinase, putative n=2 Tax=Trypanosoma brucei TaxID=5691 RepID=D0A1M0_TRYB9|nr:protein kinase, putative [Trypanosoma brucei gambiense DAL972]RHW68712.1 protein kinase [Trypanosoma brucei equiperdum]CBH15162.1 protein kinase, putative [Trypanosoma brucei gambiense DAL972]|eukprot:XP_011777428.1 protein kinase, putative [Trypanosoma brucei gambiense DAL972]
MRANDIVKGRYSTYQLQDLIGKGGNAVVYSAVDCNTGLMVAVKKMEVHDDAAMATCRNEVAILSHLKHPYVIRYIDHAHSGKSFLIVTEFALERSLLQRLKRHGRCGELEVARFMFQITSALAYLHKEKIVHRDIKCANVLLGAAEVVKLSDFGLAVNLGAVHGETNDEEDGLLSSSAVCDGDGKSVAEEGIVGSVYWMAPEAVRGEPPAESCDIWSLGCLCIELLTGNPPFFDRKPANALYCISETDETPIPTMDVSEECRNFLTQCLDRDASKRPTAAALLKHGWFGGFLAENIVKTLADTQVDGTTSDQVASNSEAIKSWVENNLFNERAEQREEWLRSGCLKRVVAVLPKVTPKVSFHIIRTFVFAAQRCRTESSCFLTRLGEADLWDSAQLGVLGKAESLGALFVCCCERQDPRVLQYAPTHPGALWFLLQCAEVDVAIMCIDALRALLVGTAGEEEENRASFSSRPEVASTNVENITFRRYVSQNRFVSDHAVYAVQRIIEDICYDAFRGDKDPAVGWQNIDKLFEILLQVYRKAGDESIILGPSVSGARQDDPQDSPKGGTGGSVAATATAAVAVSTSIGGGGGGAASAVGDPAGSAATATTSAPSSGEAGRKPINPHIHSPCSPNAGGVNTSSVVVGIASACGKGGKPAEELWLLALQEASRKLCPNAIELLMQYVHLAARNDLKSLNIGGKAIAGTFLVVASNASVDTATRITVLKCLPALQCASPKAANFMRDVRCSVPLLVHTAKNIPVPAEARDDEVLKVLFALCEDNRVAAAFASYGAFIAIAIDRATLACERQRWAEVTLAVRFVELLLAHATDTSCILESHALLRLLLKLSDGDKFPSIVTSVAQRLLNSLQAQTNVG